MSWQRFPPRHRRQSQLRQQLQPLLRRARIQRPRLVGGAGNDEIDAGSGTNWVAGDDARFEFPEPCEQLIHCDGGRGMGPEQCEIIRQWLL